jgi:hypothetical protein
MHRSNPYSTWYAAISLGVVAAFGGASGLVVLRRPTDRGAAFAAFALLLFGAITFPDFAEQAVLTVPSVWPAAVALDLLGRVAFTIFLFVFPDGRFMPRWMRWVALVWVLVQLPGPFLKGDAAPSLKPIYDVAIAQLGGTLAHRRESDTALPRVAPCHHRQWTGTARWPYNRWLTARCSRSRSGWNSSAILV